MECDTAKFRFFPSLLRAYKNLTQMLTYDHITPLLQSDEISATDCQLSWPAETHAVKYATTNDIFDLFVHSHRVRTDLENEIGFGSPDVVLVFREWEERVSPHLEFRGFVSDNQLNALSQYDFRFAYDDVLLNKDKILETIQRYSENAVRPRFRDNEFFPNGQYVVNFLVILNEGEIKETKVIEMNRFDVTTGGSLFAGDEDAEVLFGRTTFEFRVVQQWAMKPKAFHFWLTANSKDFRRQCFEAILDERPREERYRPSLSTQTKNERESTTGDGSGFHIT
jgi:hypothetical protein